MTVAELVWLLVFHQTSNQGHKMMSSPKFIVFCVASPHSHHIGKDVEPWVNVCVYIRRGKNLFLSKAKERKNPHVDLENYCVASNAKIRAYTHVSGRSQQKEKLSDVCLHRETTKNSFHCVTWKNNSWEGNGEIYWFNHTSPCLN